MIRALCGYSVYAADVLVRSGVDRDVFRYPMLLFLVKAFFSVVWNLTSVGFAEGRTRQGWAAPGGRAGSY
jgi:hypothetical protein